MTAVPLSIQVDLDAERVAAAFDGAIVALDREMALAMLEAVDLVAARARQTDAFVDRTGQLRASIQPSDPPVTGTFFAGSLEGAVGFGATSGGFPYGLAIELGSRAHTIEPVNRKALRWPAGGGFRFARRVRHPGTQAKHFMRGAFEASVPEIETMFTEAIRDALDSAGFR